MCVFTVFVYSSSGEFSSYIYVGPDKDLIKTHKVPHDLEHCL